MAIVPTCGLWHRAVGQSALLVARLRRIKDPHITKVALFSMTLMTPMLSLDLHQAAIRPKGGAAVRQKSDFQRGIKRIAATIRCASTFM